MTEAERLLGDPAFKRLKSFVIESTGLAFYAGRETELAGHLAKRLTTTGSADAEAYLHLLQRPGPGDAELDVLVADLTIGETYFFRYTEQFDALRDIIFPALLERNRDRRRLRIWSAGCATGPEPYSLSILLRGDMAEAVKGWDISILGTDINRDFLARARVGEFAEWAFRGVSPTLRSACFSRRGDVWSILPQYRQGVYFQYHNLVRHPFPSLVDGLAAFDLILCRNVFIYFDSPTLKTVIDQMADCLVDGGWLLVGHAESQVELFRNFRTISAPGATLYQKAADDALPVPWPAWQAPDWTTPSASASLPPPRASTEPPRIPPPSEPRRMAPDPALLRSLMNQARWEQAESVCRELLGVDRLDPGLHLHLALIEEQRGRLEQAEQSLRRSLYLDRNFVPAHYHLGLLLQRRSDSAGAVRSMKNALRLLQSMPPDQPFYPEGPTASHLQELATMHLELFVL